jgi:hypothetical protein
VQTRRILLLFALVLGVAVIVASVPRTEQRTTPARPPAGSGREPETAVPAPAPGAAISVRFRAGRRPQTRRLDVGRAAIVRVEVPAAGDVEIDDLGMTAPADPFTPARFDVLEPRPGKHVVSFVPAAGNERVVVGTLLVAAPRPRPAPRRSKPGAT